MGIVHDGGSSTRNALASGVRSRLEVSTRGLSRGVGELWGGLWGQCALSRLVAGDAHTIGGLGLRVATRRGKGGCVGVKMVGGSRRQHGGGFDARERWRWRRRREEQRVSTRETAE
jgi:hypothetical protein